MAQYPLLPIFRSDHMARLVTHLYLTEVEASMTDLAKVLTVNRSSVTQVIPELERSGMVSVRNVGRTRLVKANTGAPFYRPLRELIEIVAGPPAILSEELSGIAGLSQAFIFGSWAARASGVPGRQPRDVDVLIVGNPSRTAVAEACYRAGLRLAREVNPKHCPADVWASREDAFFGALATEPLTTVLLVDKENRHEASHPDDGDRPGDWAVKALSALRGND